MFSYKNPLLAGHKFPIALYLVPQAALLGWFGMSFISLSEIFFKLGLKSDFFLECVDAGIRWPMLSLSFFLASYQAHCFKQSMVVREEAKNMLPNYPASVVVNAIEVIQKNSFKAWLWVGLPLSVVMLALIIGTSPLLADDNIKRYVDGGLFIVAVSLILHAGIAFDSPFEKVQVLNKMYREWPATDEWLAQVDTAQANGRLDNEEFSVQLQRNKEYIASLSKPSKKKARLDAAAAPTTQPAADDTAT